MVGVFLESIVLFARGYDTEIRLTPTGLLRIINCDMRVLIIGAKGMLGAELVRTFSSAGHAVTAWDREEIDICNFSNSQLNDFNLLINAAAYNNADKAEEEPDVADAINGHAVGRLAAACREQGIPLIHYSTDYVFDGKSRTPYTEDDIPNPQSVYARSKRLGETLLESSGADYWIIRTSRLFGRPAAAPGAKKSFPDLMIELAKIKRVFDLVDEEISSPTYARDLAERTLGIVRDREPFGIYHVANAGGCTWYEYGKTVFALSGIDVTCRPVSSSAYPRLAKRPMSSVLGTTKLPLLRPWQAALQEYLHRPSS